MSHTPSSPTLSCTACNSLLAKTVGITRNCFQVRSDLYFRKMTQEAVGKYRREWGRDREVRAISPLREDRVKPGCWQQRQTRHGDQWRDPLATEGSTEGGKAGSKADSSWVSVHLVPLSKVEINKDEKQVCWVGGSYFI